MDLKAENIMVGSSDPETIYLIDFGLARPYIENGIHFEEQQLGGFSGNMYFASHRGLKGFS